jgi:hypothetical protein
MVQEKVTKFILQNTMGREGPKQVRLSPENFKQFKTELPPWYFRTDGSSVPQPEIENAMGFMGITYMGVPIILDTEVDDIVGIE